MHSPNRLLNYCKNVYSQYGEDGIIERILQLIPERDNWCVEFGAWDGQHLSNTRYLIEDYGFNAVLIEGDPIKYRELKKIYSNNDMVIPMNRFAGWTPPQTLDLILNETIIPKNYDFLSVDIDGNDYHVLAALKDYSPKVICVEFNPTIPNAVEFVQKPDFSINQGSSLLSLVKLGKLMGYEPVAVTLINVFFVKKEYFHVFDLEDNSISHLRENLTHITNIFVGYDGTIFLAGCKCLPWHGVQMQDKNFQVLPSYLRSFPDNYSYLQRFIFYLLKQVSNLSKLLSKIKNKCRAYFRHNY